MIVTRLDDLLDRDRDVRGPVWTSRRFLLAEDGVGFTLTETTVGAGAEQIMWYKHHVEANYVIECEGEVENVATGEVYSLKPGTMYTLDNHEKHRQRAFSRMRIVCVFTPALIGGAAHDEEGPTYRHRSSIAIVSTTPLSLVGEQVCSQASDGGES